ncbi:MAG: 2-oxo-hepta-3-ene-1,7-dioic acid hydratase [Alphaproteobacteria bacterium]|nr:2-oxo-hepta-3-ene-1,7-dioic acid hydratase [Alphaproteobacteria bacterium]
MIKNADVQKAAETLYQAEQTQTQIGLLSLQYPDLDMDDAYKIQDALVALKKQKGHKQIGWKIGLTSKAMQSALNIDIPDSGVLFDNMLFANGANIVKNHFIQPRIEAEIAFIMKHDVRDASRDAIITATDYITPSIEILDTRIIRKDKKTGIARKIFDTIADNAANAGVILGDEKHALQDFDLRFIGVICKCNDAVEETGLGAGVLDDPLTSMLWLVQRLQHYGQMIKAGDIVLSGSFIRPIECPSGSGIFADFGAFGSVRVNFE